MQIQQTKIQIYDSFDELVADIEMFDSNCATVSINYTTNVSEWLEIAEHVHQALLQMNLEGDK